MTCALLIENKKYMSKTDVIGGITMVKKSNSPVFIKVKVIWSMNQVMSGH